MGSKRPLAKVLWLLTVLVVDFCAVGGLLWSWRDGWWERGRERVRERGRETAHQNWRCSGVSLHYT